MGKGKTWSSEECEAAAKAYVQATLDDINGSANKTAEFASCVHQIFEEMAPPGVKGTGTWWERDPDGDKMIVWEYVCDNILKPCQKFNGKLNIVINMRLSGIQEHENVNIAVALFLNKVDKEKPMQTYKDFDVMKWRLYKAWSILKETDKLAPPEAACHPSSLVAPARRSTTTAGGNGGDSNDHHIDLSTPSSESTDEGFITDCSSINVTNKRRSTRGGGRDAAKRAEDLGNEMKKRTAHLAQLANNEKKKVQALNDIKNQLLTQNMIAMLNNPMVDASLKQTYMQRINFAMDKPGTSHHQETPSSAPRMEEAAPTTSRTRPLVDVQSFLDNEDDDDDDSSDDTGGDDRSPCFVMNNNINNTAV